MKLCTTSRAIRLGHTRSRATGAYHSSRRRAPNGMVWYGRDLIPYHTIPYHTTQYKSEPYSDGDFLPAYAANISENFSNTNNLYQLLLHFQNPDMPRQLWIDQICINQSDLEEKATQIRMMNEIYSAAGVPEEERANMEAAKATLVKHVSLPMQNGLRTLIIQIKCIALRMVCDAPSRKAMVQTRLDLPGDCYGP